jgi:carotenoid cleavage dioxygenase-like enzyme
LATWDWDSGRSDRFLFGDTQIMEEAVFVPHGPDEADAWLIAPSINLAEGVTELHAFNAARVSDGPVATWRADIALPAGFHGVWAG